MNNLQFVNEVETYFGGKYNERQKIEVLTYLQAKNEMYLKFLYKVLTEHYSTQYKTPPAIKEFKDSESDVLQFVDHEKAKQAQIETKKENQLLLEGTVSGNTIMVNGVQEHIGAYLLHCVADACNRGVNPKHDPEVIRIGKIVESRSRIY